jgi:uncharacterized cupredoxin-like copper-binding protein
MRKITSIAAALLLLAGAACSSETGIKVALDEYSIKLAQGDITAGPQTFSVTDRGAIAHQFLVLRTNRPPDDLPVGKDGIVEVDAKGIDEVGELEILSPGERETLDVRLRPGPYVLICNISGHYGSGMHTGFRAR